MSPEYEYTENEVNIFFATVVNSFICYGHQILMYTPVNWLKKSVSTIYHETSEENFIIQFIYLLTNLLT